MGGMRNWRGRDRGERGNAERQEVLRGTEGTSLKAPDSHPRPFHQSSGLPASL